MALRLVIDETAHPAAFGRAAAEVARELGARFMHLPAKFDLETQPDAMQYVHAAGGLGPSGLYFAEQILGEPVPAAASLGAVVAAAGIAEIVVPIHPAFGQREGAVRDAAGRAGVVVTVQAAAQRADSGPSRPGQVSCTVALIGREYDHRAVYPAALASLRAAAAALGIDLSIDFNDPKQLDEKRLRKAQAILLPGGSDMGNVSGQIRAAHHGLAHDLPVLGLCLGMQTMTTAFAQRLLGDEAVNLAEADPAAPTKSFVAMADVEPALLPCHRTGDATLEIEPGTLLAEIMQASTMSIRCNHRYHLAPALRPILSRAGLTASAVSFGARVVDAVEWRGHPFFLGLQGHPELTPGPTGTHPVFAAFLRAALGIGRR